VSSLFATQLRRLARRSVVRTFRDPANIAPGIIIPVLLFFVLGKGLQSVTSLKGFPTDNFEDFALIVAFMEGGLLATITAGQMMALDIETGFVNRLALTPIRQTALLASQLAGPFLLGLLNAAVYVGVGYAAGVRPEAGPAGMVTLVVLFLVIVLGFGAMGMFVGLRTGSSGAVQAMVPLTTIVLFLSSAVFPRNLIEKDWFKWIATVNPISYLVEGMRSLVITGWDVQALGLGFGIAAGGFLLMLVAAAATMRGRLVRT
jgi:ABC-2 type transport system permease protein